MVEFSHFANVSSEALDLVITENHLLDVCNFLPEKEILASALGLQPDDVADSSKEVMLNQWRLKEGDNATYKKLVQILVGLGQSTLILKIFDFLPKKGRNL